MRKVQTKDRKLSGTPLRAGYASEARRNEISEPPGTKTRTVLEPEPRSRRRATGPRTSIGKKRSSLNAQKYGIFSKDLLVGDESPREFSLLLDGLRDDLQPEGTLEALLVEKLATILWRKRRILRAESAEIGEGIQYSVSDTVTALIGEEWDYVRSGGRGRRNAQAPRQSARLTRDRRNA
jgi:hypothetical protein